MVCGRDGFWSVAWAILFVVAWSGLSGCSGAFGRAMDQGDASAALGDWDAAALAYERAVRLDPDDEDAIGKLRLARRAQAQVRVQRAEALIAQGAHRQALGPLAEAVALDAHNLRARTLFVEVTRKLLDEAEAALAAGRGREALAIVGEVLATDAYNVRARELDARVREAVAAEAYARGMELSEAGRSAGALLSFAAATEVKPGFRDAELRLAALRAGFVASVEYTAVMAPFSADQRLAVVVGEITPERVRAALPGGIPLRVTGDLPAEVGAEQAGLRLGGHLEGYAFEEQTSATDRSCTYVCERTMVPNPDRAWAESDVDAARAHYGSAGHEVARAESQLRRDERELRTAERQLERAEARLARAQEQLAECQAKPGRTGADCESERRRVEEARAARDREEADLASPRRAVQTSEAAVASARQERDEQRLAVERAEATLSQTPALVERIRTCDHGYRVLHHEVDGRMVVRLSARNLSNDGVVYEDEEIAVAHRTLDESFEAERGFCAELEGGDPKQTPAEYDVQLDLAKRGTKAVARLVLAAYEAERATRLERGKAATARGLYGEAVEILAAYLVMSADDNPIAAEPTVVREIARLSQVPSTSVSRLFR